MAASSAAVSRHMFMPAIAVLGVVYSSIFPVNRMSAESGDPYIGYVFWFSLIASAALLGACALRRQMPPITLPHVRAYAILGIVGVALPVPLLTYVAPKVPVGIITLELALVPLLTYLISWLLRIERLRASGVVGLMFGLAGMLLVLVPDVGLPDPDMVGWAALALVAPLCFACANAFATVFRPPAASSLVMAAGLTTCATIMLAPVIVASGHAYVFPGPVVEGNLAVLAAAAITAVCTICWFAIVRRVGPVYFSQFNYFIVLGGFGWGMVLYGERHSWLVWVAVALAFAGLAVFNFGAARAARAAAARVTTPAAPTATD